MLAGLTHTWVLDDLAWMQSLVTVANSGDPRGPLQVTEGMYLMLDTNGDGALDRHCSPPGWDSIHAMDPRHSGWRGLILGFYATVAAQPQHDGVVVDMLDAYPFCEGGWSGGVDTPIDSATWISSQDELLGLIEAGLPGDQWLFANAGRDFPEGSPFPRHLNGYLLENFLGEWGLDLEGGLTSAQRALETTKAPHIVVFAVDTDDTGAIDWPRFRVGLAASLLMDNTFFAFDSGARDHGGVRDWWFPENYDIALGNPLGPYTLIAGVYRRDFEGGAVVIAADGPASVNFASPHTDPVSGETGLELTVPAGDARILLVEAGS